MIYVMSDIHGQKRRFDSVMRQSGLRAEDTLYVLGDVIDRNPDGIGILRDEFILRGLQGLCGKHIADHARHHRAGAVLLDGHAFFRFDAARCCQGKDDEQD